MLVIHLIKMTFTFPWCMIKEIIFGGTTMNQKFSFILIAIALAMGVSTFVLHILNEIDISTALSLLSISIICLALVRLKGR